MIVLAFDCGYAPDLEALGHTVVNLRDRQGILSLPDLLEQERLAPDCIIQQERLGPRLLIRGLESAPCPTAFLAVDSHLNMFWHKSYARLFDTLLTPHLSLFAALPPEWRHPDAVRFAHCGAERPWKPHAERSRDLALCARMTEHRRIRAWLVALLGERHGLELRENLSFAAMLDFYADTRIIPNECIGYEVNFRLFESASCGALALTPDVGEDQDSAFTPGKEILVYRDGLELLEHAAWARAHPAEAERMGRAAWERVRAEHLPRHRAETLAGLARRSGGRRARGEEAAGLFWLSVAQLARNGACLLPVSLLLEQSEQLAPDPDTLAARLRLLAETGRGARALALCRDLLARESFPESLSLNAAASACALRLGDFAVARQFRRRHLLHADPPDARDAGDPANPFALCLLWSDALRRARRAAQPGFAFAPETGHAPETAYEFLLLAKYIDAANPEADAKADALCAQLPAYTVFRLGHLARLSLLAPDDWRLQLEYGLASLRACRVTEGLFEIREAGDKAAQQGKAASFARVLAAHPSRAYIERELATFPS